MEKIAQKTNYIISSLQSETVTIDDPLITWFTFVDPDTALLWIPTVFVSEHSKMKSIK